MSSNNVKREPDAFWEKAGEVGYAKARYHSNRVERHIRQRFFQKAIDTARELGTEATGHVLELGCGDGTFANEFLAMHFRAVDAFDKSEAAIARARAMARAPNVRFEAHDLVQLDYSKLPRYDAVFLMGFLHHVKSATPAIVGVLARVTPRIIVEEPNGNNLLRKALELTPAYRRQGEDSFRTNELIEIFESVGYVTRVWYRLSIFPVFTPEFIFRLLLPLERRVEASSFLKALCTTGHVFGFEKPALK